MHEITWFSRAFRDVFQMFFTFKFSHVIARLYNFRVVSLHQIS